MLPASLFCEKSKGINLTVYIFLKYIIVLTLINNLYNETVAQRFV